MADQVTLPLVGATNKRVLYIGGGAAVLVMGVLYLRKKKTAVTPTAAATDTSSATDTTGLDTSGAGGGFFTGGGAGSGGFPIGGGAGGFTSNAQWFAAAMQDLSGVVDPAALASALGKYLTGAAVTGDQESLIDQAIAAGGYPPVHGPNDYPPGIRQQPGGGQTPPPPPPPSGGGSTPPPQRATFVTHVTDAKSVDELVGFWHMTRQDLWNLNPGLQSTVAKYKAGKGYGNWPGAIDVLNVGPAGRDVTVYQI